ncbi:MULTISPECIES: hypothetical protein [Stenotrophomonas]|uniref:hypothetical protein n=1 Tax=Stenotrophomonas maltophilia TaxID=40324 RepID=UPI003D18B752
MHRTAPAPAACSGRARAGHRLVFRGRGRQAGYRPAPVWRRPGWPAWPGRTGNASSRTTPQWSRTAITAKTAGKSRINKKPPEGGFLHRVGPA